MFTKSQIYDRILILSFYSLGFIIKLTWRISDLLFFYSNKELMYRNKTMDLNRE